jgi:hypothetical protein
MDLPTHSHSAEATALEVVADVGVCARAAAWDSRAAVNFGALLAAVVCGIDVHL